jgi:hypothetical protein
MLQVMYMQLRTGNTYEVLSWKRMFDVMLQLCNLFSEPHQDTQAGPLLFFCSCVP